MIRTIFSGLPKGVSVRRLDERQTNPLAKQKVKFTAWNESNERGYGNTIKQALNNIGQEPTVHTH